MKLRRGTMLGAFVWTVLVYAARVDVFPEGSR